MTPQRAKFKKAVYECWGEMRAGDRNVSPGALGSCMKEKLRGRRAGPRKARKRGRKRGRR